jgi:hypothetical protein
MKVVSVVSSVRGSVGLRAPVRGRAEGGLSPIHSQTGAVGDMCSFGVLDESSHPSGVCASNEERSRRQIGKNSRQQSLKTVRQSLKRSGRTWSAITRRISLKAPGKT